MTHWRVYESIPRVSSYLDGVASLEDLQVTSCVVRHPAPISLGCYSLTLEQSAQLRAILERAEQDVRAGAVADPPEVSCG